MSTSKNIDILKKNKNQSCNALRRRKAFLVLNNILEESEEILNSKDDAQASLAIKKIVGQERPTATREFDIKSVTIHFEKHFTSLSSRRVEDSPTKFLKVVSKREVISVVRDLRNNKAPDFDNLTSEDMKKDARKPTIKI